MKCFNSGYIKNPNYKPVKKAERVGEKKKQTCGMECKIIAYRGAADIDVEFEDGAKVCHVKYKSYKLGYVRHPVYKGSKKALKIIGEERVMANGQRAKIIAATSAGNLTIEFEDGAIVYEKNIVISLMET